MSKNIKNTKQILAFVLAVALLAVSMFTGVNFAANAASSRNVVYYVKTKYNNWGDPDDSYLVAGRGDSADNPYIISTPAQFRHLAQRSTYETTYGKYFAIDPTIDIMVFQTESYTTNKLGGVDALLSKDANATKEAFETNNGTDRSAFQSAGGKFAGHFNGNGVQIVGFYATTGGFFSSVDNAAEFKNISFKNCFVNSGDYAGVLFGDATTTHTETVDQRTLKVSEIEVANCYVKSTSTDGLRVGILFGCLVGSSNYTGTKVTNCYVHDSVGYSNTNVPAGVVGSGNNWVDGTKDEADVQNSDFSNCVFLDCAPYSIATAGDNQASRPTWFKNIYTNYDFAIKPSPATTGWNNFTWADYDGKFISVKKDDIKGAAAKTVLSALDWNKVWFANEGLPTLRSFHSLKAKINSNDKYAGHIEYCEHCNIQGVTTISHNYDSANKCKDCSYEKNPLDAKCGQKIVYWSGEFTAFSTTDHDGSATDPYVIENAEQFAYLLTKVDAAQSTGKYFKISDTIDTIIMQPQALVNASDITSLDSADKVATYFDNLTGKKNLMDGYLWRTFDGYLDGNGVQVYGVYSAGDKGAVGLFSQVDGNATIKNIAVKNSYFASTSDTKPAAALVGETYGIRFGAEVDGAVNLSGIAVTNNYISGPATSATVIGNANGDTVKVDTCLSFGNKSPDGALPMVANNATAISNTISIDTTPIVNGATYDKVYTNVSGVATAGVTVITATKGNAIKEQATALDWDTVWFTGEKMPILRLFHVNFVAQDNDDGTHCLKCDCGEKGEDSSHNYNKNSGTGICLDCGAQCKHKYIDKTVIQAGDCVTDRIAHQVCEYCGNDKGEVTTTATGHNFTHVDYKAETCKAPGNEEHQYCSKCENCFDKDADTFAAMSTAFDPTRTQLPHTAAADDYGNIYKMSDTQHWKVCANDYCGEKFDVETHAGSYVSDGADGHHGFCSTCGVGSTTTVPHEYGDDSTCDLCGYTCSEHVWDAGTVTQQGSCTADHIVKYTCQVCHKVETTVTVAVGHTFEKVDKYAGDCATKGNIAYNHCTVCGNNYSSKADVMSEEPIDDSTIYTKVNSDNHVFVKVEGVAATCKTSGIMDYMECKYCKQKASVNDTSKLLSDEDVIIAAGKHNVTAVAITKDTNAHYVCEDCGKVFADASATMEVTSADLALGTTIGSANVDTGNTSPKTSDVPVAPVAVVTALVGVAFVTFRKFKKA